jgi:signal transduction histidine kinase
VGGATALLAGTTLDAEQRELVALLEAGTAHVVLIVDDILLHGALVSGAFPVVREPLSLARGVLEPAFRMVSLQRPQRAKLASLRLSRAVAPGVPQVVLGDATRLTQVVTNLLGNSVKFTPEGPQLRDALHLRCRADDAQTDAVPGGAIHMLVSVTDEAPHEVPPGAAVAEEAHAPRRWLRFQVTDSGIGLDPGASFVMPHLRRQPLTCAAALQPSWSISSSLLYRRACTRAHAHANRSHPAS